MARKAGSAAKGERQRIQFAYNADRDSAIGVVFQYLIDNFRFSSREGKHKGLDAMAAFWKPFAYQERGDLSQEELQDLAHEAIEALSHQIKVISDTFGVEAPQVSSKNDDLAEVVQHAVSTTLQNLLQSGALNLASQTLPQTQAATETPSVQSPVSPLLDVGEGIDFDEDALLGNLFDSADIAA
jgi:hypothetical protein